MSYAGYIALALALILAFVMGAAIGIGWGKEIVFDAVAKFGHHSYDNKEITGKVVSKKNESETLTYWDH